MFIHRLEVGLFATNCYILACSKTKEGVIIDPGGGAKDIFNICDEKGFKIKYIINTHGHIDHTFENKRVKNRMGAELLIGEDDAPMLTSPTPSNFFVGIILKSPPPDRTLKEGDEISIGKLKIKVIHTPGHTPGGISLLVNNKVLFSGDTLFAGSVGRTDLPGGSTTQLINSIKKKLLILPDEVKVYPGHGPPTTIGQEKRYNPFVTGKMEF